MNTKSNTTARTTLAASLALCFAGAASAQDAAAPADNTHLPPAQEQHGAPPTNWNDTFVGYRYASDFHFPGSAAKVAQNIGSLTTTGGFGLGSYFFNVDYLQSDRNNPEASPAGVSGVGTHGADETYSVGHVEWSGSKILHQHLGFGFVRDLGVTTGYEWGTKDDQFEQRAKMWMLGLTAEFAVPGYWNLTVGARNEQNYNGITGVDLHYKTAWHLDSAWMIPINGAPVQGLPGRHRSQGRGRFRRRHQRPREDHDRDLAAHLAAGGRGLAPGPSEGALRRPGLRILEPHVRRAVEHGCLQLADVPDHDRAQRRHQAQRPRVRGRGALLIVAAARRGALPIRAS
jgi:nucleoside-specific outer membrane channel protein Tsx